uniref:Ig-like domain-containing protein n=1 Tax=Erpetoichthys calabaricus TaxID=27687 RepID=A0A8C4XB24_ERPCA
MSSCLMSLFLLFSVSESLLIVQTTQPDPVVHVGSEVLLQCSFTVTSGAIDVKQLTVTWIQYALTVAKYDQEDLIERPRLSLNAEGMKSGNASLLIRSVHFDDGGQYRCIVQHKEKKETWTSMCLSEVSRLLKHPDLLVTQMKLLVEGSNSTQGCVGTMVGAAESWTAGF